MAPCVSPPASGGNESPVLDIPPKDLPPVLLLAKSHPLYSSALQEKQYCRKKYNFLLTLTTVDINTGFQVALVIKMMLGEKAMAAHSSALAWKIPWMETPDSCSPWGREESDTTERLHFSLSCTGDGNGNPLQYSCLENPRDGGAWWAAVYGVAQNQTQLKQLSSSSGKEPICQCRRHKRLGFNLWVGKIPWSGLHSNPLQYSCLENLMDRGACWATVHRVTKSWT